jgi:hypothetical protein
MKFPGLAASFFRHGSNALLVAGSAALAAAALAGRVAMPPWAIALGALLFSASEYSTHRFLLHARPVRSAFVRRLQHRLHYDHHVEPARLDLLFLPPWFVLPALAIFTAIYAAVWRDSGIVAGVVLGNLLGLLYYEWVHYVAHVAFVPFTPFGRWIKKYHLWHHFKNERLWFGVTNPVLDHLWRTYADVAAAGRSATTRVLFK